MATVEAVRPFPIEIADDVRAAAVRAAEERGVSLNDVYVGELCAHFGVPFEPTGRGGSGPRTDGGGNWQFRRVPPACYEQIVLAELREPAGTKSDRKSRKRVINRILRERLL